MPEKGQRKKIIMYALGIFLFLMIHYALNLAFLSFLGGFIPFLKNLSFTLAIACIILVIRTILEALISSKTTNRGDEYNLLRVVRLISTILIIIIVVLFTFQKANSFLESLGLASLVLGFALQAPITSFIAWLYVIFRRPYQVGDRIQINEHRGDVVEITYLDTIIFEISGDYLGNDRKSGRLVHFPNSMILKDKVINYSGNQAPFIWNETAVQVAYTSDLEFVKECLEKVTWEDFEKRYPQKAKISDQWRPAVYFRTNPRSWMEAVVQYPVEPEDTTGRRNRILRAALPLMNAEPGKVQFPEGTAR